MMPAKFTTITLRAANHYDTNSPNEALMNNFCPLGLTAYFIFTRGRSSACRNILVLEIELAECL